VVSATLPSSAWQCAALRRVGHRARAIPGQDRITDARQTDRQTDGRGVR